MAHANRLVQRLGVALVAVALLAGCGTRVTADRVERASGLGGQRVVAAENAGSASSEMEAKLFP